MKYFSKRKKAGEFDTKEMPKILAYVLILGVLILLFVNNGSEVISSLGSWAGGLCMLLLNLRVFIYLKRTYEAQRELNAVMISETKETGVMSRFDFILKNLAYDLTERGYQPERCVKFIWDGYVNDVDDAQHASSVPKYLLRNESRLKFAVAKIKKLKIEESDCHALVSFVACGVSFYELISLVISAERKDFLIARIFAEIQCNTLILLIASIFIEKQNSKELEFILSEMRLFDSSIKESLLIE